MDPDTLQILVAAVLSSGLVSGAITFLTKKARSPESQNQLAKLGNDFAAQLLTDARTEREELRLTIKELESSNDTKQSSIDRLTGLLNEKDRRINELEERQQVLAHKLQRGEAITLVDIFGAEAPEIQVLVSERVA